MVTPFCCQPPALLRWRVPCPYIYRLLGGETHSVAAVVGSYLFPLVYGSGCRVVMIRLYALSKPVAPIKTAPAFRNWDRPVCPASRQVALTFELAVLVEAGGIEPPSNTLQLLDLWSLTLDRLKEPMIRHVSEGVG